MFTWPGPDLRFVPGKGPESAAYGFLPPALFKVVRDGFLERARRRQAGLVPRTELQVLPADQAPAADHCVE